MGERFTALPSNHPLGHYFDALHLTGYYYTFIGIGQLMAALLLLIPRTALLGAMLYFPIIVNICVLTYAVRFEGTRIATLMLLANLFLLAWDYDRLNTFCRLGGSTKILTSWTRPVSSQCGNPLNACLDEYQRAKGAGADPGVHHQRSGGRSP